MTTKEALLLKVIEECDELSQRCTKAIRFGLEEVQPNQYLTNAERLVSEYKDLVVAANMLYVEGYISNIGMTEDEIASREEKVNNYMSYSRQLGTIKD